jgi:hypothetical protein
MFLLPAKRLYGVCGTAININLLLFGDSPDPRLNVWLNVAAAASSLSWTVDGLFSLSSGRAKNGTKITVVSDYLKNKSHKSNFCGTMLYGPCH